MLTLDAPEINRMIIPGDDVALVYEDNTAEHALLVLIKSGYSAVPVLRTKNEVVGIVSKTLILDKILGLSKIDFDLLQTIAVGDVMNPTVPKIQLHQTFLKALQISIDAPFLIAEDENHKFIGLLTRRHILALIQQHLRES
jgi:predicted transcriptional regulator